MILLALACTASDGNGPQGTTDAAAVDSGDPGVHPNVPPGYEYKWDTSGEGCDRGSQYYFLAGGETDAEGNFTGWHATYWFYGGDWEDDDIDTFTLAGTPTTRAWLDANSASESEEGYEIVRSGDDVQSGWGDDDTDLIYAFDTLSPSGNLNYENAMLVYRWTQGGWGSDDDEWKGDFDYARGVFTPLGDDPAPPATYTWEGDGCSGW